MSRPLSTGQYIFLLCINFIIGFMAAYSIRWHPNNLDTVDAAILKTNSIISNRAKILTFIKMNCTKLLIQFPELEALPDIDLCNRYQF